MMTFTTKDLVRQSFLALIYVVLTIINPWSDGNIQFRVSEFLLFTVLISPKNAIGMILGCLIANIWSALGIWDVVFGTFATSITIYLMIKTKNDYLAWLWPAIINGLIIGTQIAVLWDLPWLLSMFQVFIGEFVVTFVLALFLWKPLKHSQTVQKILA